MKIYVKNMACESCKVVVKEVLKELEIPTIKVQMGEIETKEDLTDDQKRELNKKIKKVTGLTPSHFKSIKVKRRISIQEM